MKKLFWISVFLLYTAIAALGQGLFEEALDQSEEAGGAPGNMYGSVRNVLYAGNSKEAGGIYVQSLYSQFNLMTEMKAGSYGKGVADLRFRSGYEFDKRFSEILLREAYGEVYLGPLTIKTGKQILSWGASSFMNPSDRFSPSDPAFRSPYPDDLRLGVWAVRTDLLVSTSSTLRFLWLPLYQPSRLLFGPFDFPEELEIRDADDPLARLDKSGFGFRYDLRTSIMDLQISYFNGYRNDPAITADTAIFDPATFEPRQIDLAQTPFRIHNAGVNLTVPAGSYLFRFEGGWMEPYGDDAPAEKPFSELSYVFEIEQSGPEISLIAGYYGKYIIGFEPAGGDVSLLTNGFPSAETLFPPGTIPDMTMVESYMSEQIAGFNRLYNYQQEEFYHAVYASATVSMFHELIDLEMPGMYNFTAGELLLMPSLKFNVTDGLAVQMGAWFMSGKAVSLYDMVAPVLNAGYLVVELNF